MYSVVGDCVGRNRVNIAGQKVKKVGVWESKKVETQRGKNEKESE